MHNVQFISVGGSRRDEMQAGRAEDDDDGEEKNGGREEKSEVEERGRRYSIINEREKDRANREREARREKSATFERSRIKIFSLRGTNYKTMPLAREFAHKHTSERARALTHVHMYTREHMYMSAGITILGPTIMPLINNLLRRDAILFTANQLR